METENIISLARNGSKEAQDELIRNHRAMINNLISRFIPEKDFHKDILQNIFCKILESIKEFKGRCQLTTWIYRITFNECMEFRRQRAKSKSLQSDDNEPFIDPNAPDGFQITSDLEIKKNISMALNLLPLDQKTAFLLFYFGGYSGKDASLMLKISEQNFFMKLKAARDSVRKYLISKGIDLCQ